MPEIPHVPSVFFGLAGFGRQATRRQILLKLTAKTFTVDFSSTAFIVLLRVLRRMTVLFDFIASQFR